MTYLDRQLGFERAHPIHNELDLEYKMSRSLSSSCFLKSHFLFFPQWMTWLQSRLDFASEMNQMLSCYSELNLSLLVIATFFETFGWQSDRIWNIHARYSKLEIKKKEGSSSRNTVVYQVCRSHVMLLTYYYVLLSSYRRFKLHHTFDVWRNKQNCCHSVAKEDIWLT